MNDISPNLISIIIPCRNSEKNVGSLIDHLRSLHVPEGWDCEIVAGYQESRDRTLSVLKQKEVKIAFSSEFGPGPGRNAAVKSSRGSLLFFIDSDARPVDKDILLNIIRAVGKLEDFGGLGGPILLDPCQKMNPVALADHFACWFNWSGIRKSGKSRVFQPTTNFVAPRKVFETAGGFDPDFRILQDFELQERIMDLGLNVYFDSSLPVFHHARETIAASLKHSWQWGAPFREAYIRKKQSRMWLFVEKDGMFFLNLPAIFLRRSSLVLLRSLRVSPVKTFYCLPFLMMTIMAWSLGVAFGTGQPAPETENA